MIALNIAIYLAAALLAPSIALADSVEDYDVVDCSLPGQVRRLGSMTTYVTPRRPMKTTAKTCEIRGGEYVLDDPANYKSSLRIWQDAANNGDPEAQYFVGEIYEKGLTAGQPDYTLARVWYEKSAAQGYNRAAVNLGRLYEQGLGVEKSPRQAFEWYQKAAGLDTTSLANLADPAQAETIDTLSRTLKQQEKLIRQLRQQIDDLNQTRANLEQQLKQSRLEVENQRQQRNLTKQDIEARKLQLQAVEDRAAREKLKQLLASQEQKLAKASAEISGLRAELGKLYGDSASFQQEINLLTQAVASGEKEKAAELAAKKRQIAELEQTLQNRTRELDQATSALADTDKLASQYRGRMEELGNLLSKADPAEDIARYRSQLREKEAFLARQESQLTQRNQQIGRLNSQISDLEQQLAEHKKALASKRASDSPTTPAGSDLPHPVIELIDPPLMVSGGSLRLNLAAGDKRKLSGRVVAPAGFSSLTVNNNPVATSNDGRFVIDIPRLRSSNDEQVLAMVATDNHNRQAQLRLIVSSGSEPLQQTTQNLDKAHFGRYYALVIGNDRYQYWEPLKNAVNDATAVAQLLRDRYGYRVTTLVNADRKQILSTLNALRQQLTERDNLLVYYAGHGHLEKQLDRGYWIPVDAKRDDPTDWIPTYAITDQLKIMSAKHVLVVADSCYAGKLTRSSLAQLKPGISEDARLTLLKTFSQKRVRTALTSGGLTPVADGGGGKHSVFSKAFLDVLAENHLVLEADRLFLAIRARVTQDAAKHHMEQIPTYEPIHMAGHETGDFIFIPL